MTEERLKELSWKKPCRGFMLIAYNKNDPSEVYGYDPKHAAFYRNQGYVWTYRGKQEPTMLDNIIRKVRSLKSWPSKWIKRHRKENDPRPRTNIGGYFSFRKHLNRHLELKIIRISSDNCEYLAINNVKGSWWPRIEIRPREQVISWFKQNNKTEKDALDRHRDVLRMNMKAKGN